MGSNTCDTWEMVIYTFFFTWVVETHVSIDVFLDTRVDMLNIVSPSFEASMRI